MSDVILTALFAALSSGFALLAIWSMGKAKQDVERTAALNSRVLRLERMTLPAWVFEDEENDA